MLSDLAQVYVDAFQVATTLKVPTPPAPAPVAESRDPETSPRVPVRRRVVLALANLVRPSRVTAFGTGTVAGWRWGALRTGH